MSSLNRFNWIAPYYDTLTCLVFGNTIWKAQTGYLNYVPPHATVLVLGGGSGKWLRDLLQRNETCQICFVEASSKMVELAKKNLKSDRVRFVHGTEHDLQEERFDVVITQFFVDMYNDYQLSQLLLQIKSTLNNGAIYLVSDFENSKFWHKAFSRIMYLFFNLSNSIDVRSLPNWNSVFIHSSLRCIDSTSYYGNFIKSRVYILEE